MYSKGDAVLPENHPDREELLKLHDTLRKQIRDISKCLEHVDFMLKQDLILNDTHALDYKDRVVSKSKFIIGSLNDYTRYKKIEEMYTPHAFTHEKTYRRDLAYSLFHRSFDKKCYTIDLDFLEYRKVNGVINPVCLYDVKSGINFDQIPKYKKGYLVSMHAYKSVADSLHIPFWVVNYTPNMDKPISVYEIIDVGNMDYIKRVYTPMEYRNLIESL